MGKKYIEHSGMCGCTRCARQGDSDYPQPVFDYVEDPNYLDCGCHKNECDCARYDDFYDDDD